LFLIGAYGNGVCRAGAVMFWKVFRGTFYCSFSRSYVAIKYSSELERACAIGSTLWCDNNHDKSLLYSRELNGGNT